MDHAMLGRRSEVRAFAGKAAFRRMDGEARLPGGWQETAHKPALGERSAASQGRVRRDDALGLRAALHAGREQHARRVVAFALRRVQASRRTRARLPFRAGAVARLVSLPRPFPAGRHSEAPRIDVRRFRVREFREARGSRGLSGFACDLQGGDEASCVQAEAEAQPETAQGRGPGAEHGRRRAAVPDARGYDHAGFCGAGAGRAACAVYGRRAGGRGD